MQVKIAAVSSNTNSFGLRNHIFISRTGEAFQGCANNLNGIQRGSVIMLDAAYPLGTLVRLGFELAERLSPDPPMSLVALVWSRTDIGA